MINPRPLLLDSTVLLSYERDLTRRAQAFVVDDPGGPLQILPLSMNALDVGTLAVETGPDVIDLRPR